MKPKRITGRTLVGERGVNLVARIVMEMGFVWYPTGSVEAGIDGHIEIRDAATEEVLNAIIGVQSKAFDRPFPNETATGFDYYCDERDLNYWLKGNLPVVLVISRPSTEEAYWVWVNEYFRDPATRALRKVHIDKHTSRFDTASRDALFHLAVPTDTGLYLSPTLRYENLVSNLLPVAFLPDRLYVADTYCRWPGQVWRAARDTGANIGGEWILRNKRIISFRDLGRPEWAEICDRGTVEDFATEEWSQSEDEDRLREFVDLLRRALREMVRDTLDYHEKLEVLYFKPTPDLSPREVGYQGIAKATDRTVFKSYLAEDGNIKYYRHSAFCDRFHRFDGRWYLEITPTYHFTSDGHRLRWGYYRFLKRIKEIEGHEAVRGQVIMWAALLSARGDLFNQEPYPFLGFWDLATFTVDSGIDDRRWDAKRERVRKRDDEMDVQNGQAKFHIFDHEG